MSQQTPQPDSEQHQATHEVIPEGDPSTADFVTDEEHEPCPTPLEWHDILSRFIQEADHWYLETSAGQILGRTWGKGPTLYFQNGLSGTHELYSLIVWLLREDYRCVLFDYPDSPTVSRESLADLLPEVVRLHQDDGPIKLITRDFGLQIAQYCSLRHPGLLDSLICQTPHLELPLTRSERRLSKLGKKVPGKLKRVPGRQLIQQRIHRSWFPPYDPSRFDFYLDNTGEQSTRAFSQRFLLSGSPLPRWPAESLPENMLIIRAEGETPTQTRAAEELCHAVPQSQTEWLHTSGQLAFLTHPHRLAKLIKEFLIPNDTGCVS